ncbi:MAG: sigma-70 family RNA polymerase sigma factor [Pseudomonadota bacterium]
MLAELYQAHTAPIRRHLQSFGARGHDVDDLVQEVFLVLHAKRELLAQIRPLDPWLREVCRRVAASDRRRAHRRREVAFGEPLDTADEAGGTDSAFEREEQQGRLHHALTQLDEYSRDLVALHEVGDLPLVDMAELIEADRKTVRKRLAAALRRLSALIGSERSQAPTFRALGVRPAQADPLPRNAGEFRVLARHPAVNMGLVGSVLIAVWPGAATLEALEVVEQQLARAAEICAGSVAFFAVVEASTRPPNLQARKRLIAFLEDPRRRISVYAAALEGGAAWLARPIMSGLAFLARPRFAMQYFEGVPPAARWLVDSYPQLTFTSEAALLHAVSMLRSRAEGSFVSEEGEPPTRN